MGELVPRSQAFLVSGLALAVTIGVMLKGKGMARLLSILCGVVVGYGAALMMGLVDFSAVAAAPMFASPDFVVPQLNWQAVLFMLPVAIAPAVEHIGDILAVSKVTGVDYLKKPGLRKTILGDGLATSLAALLGGPPNTTYSEVTGAVAVTRVYNPAIMTWAALFAIVFAFSGKLGALLATVPVPVMGGILILLFGIIASVGLQTLVRGEVDLGQPRNMIIVSLILVSAQGGLTIEGGGVTLSGIGLGAVVGILLNLLLPRAMVE